MKARLLCAMLLVSATLSASEVRVRLWSEHPPVKMQITGKSGATVRMCLRCAGKRFEKAIFEVRDTKLLVDGRSVKEVFLAGEYEAVVEKKAVRLNWPAEIRARSGALSLVVVMPVEEYVAGVLAGEAAGMKSDESLKAMAVAARTYAMRFKGRHAGEGFDVCDTTHCQDLRVSAVTERMHDAALATEGELVWFRGEKAATYYSRSCGGKIEDGRTLMSTHATAVPYLASRQDAYCVRKGADGWRNEIRKEDLRRALESQGIRVGEVKRVEVTSRTESGRVKTMRVGGAGLTGEGFRAAIGRALGWQWIRSDAYEVMDRGESVVFAGRGQGHGVGMCQAGAGVMGDEGASYREILSYYYPGTKVGVSAQGVPWTTLGDERVEMRTVRPEVDRALLTASVRMLHEAEVAAGWKLEGRPVVKAYPTMEMYRDATGEPGWVAASTRGRVIRLQPMEVLRAKGVLESTLRHEFAHMLVEEKAKAALPMWFREGLVLWLGDTRLSARHPVMKAEQLEKILQAPKSQQEIRAAYAESRARVAEQVKRYGKPTVMSWVESGIPREVK